MIAVGVAKPNAQGQAITRTAIINFNENTKVWLARQQGVNDTIIEIDPCNGRKRSFSLKAKKERPIILCYEIGRSYLLKAPQLY